MAEGLSELLPECRAHRPSSPAERIAEGQAHWSIGHAAPAGPVALALSKSESLKLVFRQEDVTEVRRDGEHYVVRVRDGANMVASFEQVIKAAPTCGCADGSDEGAKSGGIAASTAPQAPGPTDIDVFIDNLANGCTIRVDCFTVNLPILGSTRVGIPTGFWCR